MVQHAERPATQPAPAATSGQARQTAFTTFWIYQSTGRRYEWSEAERAEARTAAIDLFDKHRDKVELRAAYAVTGLTAGADLILWVVSDDVAAFQGLSAELHRSRFGEALTLTQAYLGVASMSQYDPNHGPAFLKGIAPKRYLSVYPFTKTTNWYLLPFEQRRDLMIEHGKMGNEFPSILTNTVNSFGIADQEFVVALEDDDPAVLVKMVQRLRAAAVREYTALDVPIFLGLRKELAEALSDAI
ncbi:chlorite dismutase family protein [soil metagenome]